MTTGGEWLGAGEFAAMVGIKRRSATAAMTAQSWRGVALEVRTVRGRGGRSGHTYQISLRSLSAALDGPLSGTINAPSSVAWRPAARSDQGYLIAARYRAIEAALAHGRGTRARAAAIDVEVAKGENSERTLHRWIDQYEKHGLSGLARKRPEDAGNARVVVSRPYDRAFLAGGYSPELLAEIGHAVVQEAKALWASRAEVSGVNEVRRLLEFRLLEFCEARGVEVPPAALRLSRRHVERFSKHRVVNRYRNDRKGFDDAKPRIKRDWTGLPPMEVVIADVKPIDVIVTRPDGSPAWPRLIGFMDAGTGRIFSYPVLCPQGESIRQEHVFEAFIAMTQDPEWGFPRALYLDNGSEFAGLDKLRVGLELLSEPGARTIIKAQPYNASAKPIESLFARLDRYVFAQMPGHAGGERMHKKTQTVGRPPTPYPGSWEDFCETLAALIKVFNARPVNGQWGGRSPSQWLREKLAAGWRPIHVDALVLDAAFCNRATRRVSKGRITIGGLDYHHPELSALPARTEVCLALPWRRGGDPLFQLPGGGWAYLERDHAIPAMWLDGAKETGRRQSSQKRHVAQLAKEAPPADPIAIKRRMAERLPAVTIPGRIDRIDPGAGVLALTAPMRNAAEPKPAMTEAEYRRLARDRHTARLLRSQSNVA